ncbi:MAG: histidine--tRNA ligase [Acidobacteria bacterium]|nr:histidine--tRNA ligase [Acidobacteriota bacterium]
MINNLPGTRDLLPEELAGWHVVEDCARRIFRQYGFLEIRTPIIESTELFARGIGEDTDIVGKEMYTFQDRGDRSVTLRPEATASVVRAYIQNTLYRESGITKLCYFGPMFRYEKKQKGRWRQFYQIGVEAFGSDHPALDAEIIEMALRLMDSLGVQAKLLINSVGCRKCRTEYTKQLRQILQSELENLCDDCRRRADTNCLRVFDCKIERCRPVIGKLPVIAESLCDECSGHFSSVKTYLDGAGIAYEIAPGLVRGLDYYVRTAFEIVSGDLGAQNAILGGGRYDGLSEVIGGPPVQAIGFAVGLDRLTMVLPEEKRESGMWKPDLFIAYKGDAAFQKALHIARELRRLQQSCYLDFSAGSLKRQMRLANKIDAAHVLIIGDDELARDSYTIKKMEDSSQWEVTLEELAQYLQARGKQGKVR